MIDVYVGNNTLTVSGHAGWSTFGTDIVCAGVSAIVGALYCSLNEEEIEYTYIEKDGYAKFELDDDNDKGLAFMQMAVYGLNNVAMQFSEYVTMHNCESFLVEESNE